MHRKQPVAVLIPVYKEILSRFERVSLMQCFRILSKHPIIFVAPPHLNFDEYSSLLPDKNYDVEIFEGRYFESIEGYNKLMMSSIFYKRFLKYRFILIYQLDAYVFKDDLLYWCKQNYDFIGAPQYPEENRPGNMQFLKNYGRFLNLINNLFKINHKVSNVGNGGFSLRKTRAFYILLKILRNKIGRWGKSNEDVFFRYWGNIFYPVFKLPKDEIALRFSIETSPQESLEKLNNNLPFGCHAFEKYDFEIWKPFLIN